MQYVIVVERGTESWGACIPKLPGCIAVGESRAEVLCLIHEAMEFHLEGLRDSSEPGVGE